MSRTLQPGHARPGAVTEPGLVIYRFPVGIFYANAVRLSEDVMGLVNIPDPPRWFVLFAEAIDDIDYTGAQTLLELADQLKERGIVFAIAQARTSGASSIASGSPTGSAPTTTTTAFRRPATPTTTPITARNSPDRMMRGVACRNRIADVTRSD